MKSQNSRNQGYSYFFCLMMEDYFCLMMMEGSGSGSIPLTNGSGAGSRRPKTYGSGFGSRSATLKNTLSFSLFFSFLLPGRTVRRFFVCSYHLPLLSNVSLFPSFFPSIFFFRVLVFLLFIFSLLFPLFQTFPPFPLFFAVFLLFRPFRCLFLFSRFSLFYFIFSCFLRILCNLVTYLQ
jgi:hypothetical protein